MTPIVFVWSNLTSALIVRLSVLGLCEHDLPDNNKSITNLTEQVLDLRRIVMHSHKALSISH